MKKSLLALAALTAFAGVASAQSSVTLFGLVDLSLRSQKTGTNSTQTMVPNGHSSSRLGVRGVEDLGGGMRAGFWIEGDMSADDGTAAGQMWRRRSTVSVMGGFGEIRLGRDYTPSFWNHTVFDPFGTNGVGSALNTVSTLGSGATTLVRANNSVGYFLPAMGGLYGQVQIAAGENVTGNKYTGLRVGYAAGPANVAIGWGNTKRTGAMLDDFTDINVGGSYKMGAFTLMGQYAKSDYLASSQKNALVGATMAVGAGTLRASYIRATGSQSSFEANQVALGYVHNLSKRTWLYTTYARLKNEGTAATGARFVTSGSAGAAAAGGLSSTGYEFGLAHSF